MPNLVFLPFVQQKDRENNEAQSAPISCELWIVKFEKLFTLYCTYVQGWTVVLARGLQPTFRNAAIANKIPNPARPTNKKGLNAAYTTTSLSSNFKAYIPHF